MALLLAPGGGVEGNYVETLVSGSSVGIPITTGRSEYGEIIGEKNKQVSIMYIMVQFKGHRKISIMKWMWTLCIAFFVFLSSFTRWNYKDTSNIRICLQTVAGSFFEHGPSPPPFPILLHLKSLLEFIKSCMKNRFTR